MTDPQDPKGQPPKSKLQRMLMGKSEFDESFENLAEKHRYLLAKSEYRRRELAAAFNQCQPALEAADKGVRVAVFIKRNPLIVAGGMALAAKLFSMAVSAIRGPKKKAKKTKSAGANQSQEQKPSIWEQIPVWAGRAVLVTRIAMQIRAGLRKI